MNSTYQNKPKKNIEHFNIWECYTLSNESIGYETRGLKDVLSEKKNKKGPINSIN